MEISYAEELNAQQWEAVAYCEGPSLVVAGAGSGKTRMLTYKVAYLLQHGYAPWSIMALTFTNKAAREMTARIAGLVGEEATRGLWAGTFHSVFARILRLEGGAGLGSSFTIYDAQDSRNVLKRIIRELGLDDKTYRPAAVARRISMAKNRLYDAASYAASADFREADKRNGVPELARVYEQYAERCAQADALDFDDLLLCTYRLLKQQPEVREKYRERFRYLLVDEYQDTNLAQYHIIRLLANAEGHVCAVGDDAQSIYAFRGADIGNILGFSKAFPGAKLFKLERNYRSTRNIVNAANSIIAHNKGRIPKSVYSELPMGEKLHLFSARDDLAEGRIIAGKIRALHDRKQVGWDDVAVLYRTNAQSRVLEDACRAAGVPYRVYGGLSFYQRKEVKDFMAYLRLCCNPGDEEALLRVINFPTRGLGATTLGRLSAAARKAGVGMWDVIAGRGFLTVGLTRRAEERLMAFRDMVLSFGKKAATEAPYDVALHVLEASGLKADMAQEIKAGGGPEAESRVENTEELLNGIRDFEQQREDAGGKALLADYLAEAALRTDQDQRDDGLPRVTLMTVHAAKGLEYGAVFVSGMEDDLFPTSSARFSPREMEEERRLFYVAVTRAKTYCYISYARTRRKYGQTEAALPSPFIDEIDKDYVTWDDGEAVAPYETRHPSFGAGRWGRSGRDEAGSAASGGAFSNLRRGYISGVGTSTRPSGGSGFASASHWGQSLRRVAPPAPAESAAPQPTSVTFRGQRISVGDKVRHERFGEGVVTAVEGADDDARVTVDFEALGPKKLLLKFARFELL